MPGQLRIIRKFWRRNKEDKTMPGEEEEKILCMLTIIAFLCICVCPPLLILVGIYIIANVIKDDKKK